jgi:hypothetical protein
MSNSLGFAYPLGFATLAPFLKKGDIFTIAASPLGTTWTQWEPKKLVVPRKQGQRFSFRGIRIGGRAQIAAHGSDGEECVPCVPATVFAEDSEEAFTWDTLRTGEAIELEVVCHADGANFSAVWTGVLSP